MTLDAILWILGSVVQAVVVMLLMYRRVWRTFPMFSLYSAWGLFSSAGAYAVEWLLPSSYLNFYLTNSVIDFALQFAVLIEVAWSVLRPHRYSLPRTALFGVIGLIVATGAVIWPFAAIPGFGGFSHEFGLLVRLVQTISLLRIVLFLALAAGSQFLSIGWRDRELQIATGMGFYSFVGLTVALLHTHQTMGPLYNRLDQFVVASYICSLLYWVVCFAQNEAERREFTPQMQHLLLAVAGSARATRVAMTDSSAAKSRRPKDL